SPSVPVSNAPGVLTATRWAPVESEATAVQSLSAAAVPPVRSNQICRALPEQPVRAAVTRALQASFVRMFMMRGEAKRVPAPRFGKRPGRHTRGMAALSGAGWRTMAPDHEDHRRWAGTHRDHLAESRARAPRLRPLLPHDGGHPSHRSRRRLDGRAPRAA